MFALWVKPQRELQKMVHITHSNLKVCNKMNTCNLIETCYLISVHCILSSCLISNWLAENKHSLKIIRETISVKADPKRPLLCKTCPFKVWSSEIPHVDWMKKTRMNRKKSTHWQEVLFRGMKWMKKWFVDTCYTEIEIWRLSIKET